MPGARAGVSGEAKLVEQGFEVVASTPEEFLRHVQGESDKLGKLIRDNNLVVE